MLPATAAEAAAQLTERLQRQLTRAYFMADQDRLVITFSAGVTVWKLGEDEVDHHRTRRPGDVSRQTGR